MARPAGIEPATTGLEGRCSIRLSYGRPTGLSHRRLRHAARSRMVGVEGFEPPTSCSQSRRATRLRYTPPALSWPIPRTRQATKGRLLSGAAPTVSNQTACPHGACGPHGRAVDAPPDDDFNWLPAPRSAKLSRSADWSGRAPARQPDGLTISSTVLWPVPQWQEWVCQLQIRRFQSSPWATSSVG